MAAKFDFFKYHIYSIFFIIFPVFCFFVLSVRNPLFLAFFGIVFALAIVDLGILLKKKDILIIQNGKVIQQYPLITRSFEICEYHTYEIRRPLLKKVITATSTKDDTKVNLVIDNYNVNLSIILKAILEN